MTLIVGLLLGAAIPAVAIGTVDKKQAKQIKKLKARVTALADRVGTIEAAPDTTTGLADDVEQLKNRVGNHSGDIDTLYRYTTKLGYDGNYNGTVGPSQVTLGQNHPCTNGQPRNAMWSSGQLWC